MGNRADFQLEVHVVSTSSFSELPDVGIPFTPICVFFCLLCFPLWREFCYLDVDLLVHADISELFLAPLDTAIAAVPEFWNKKHRKKWQLPEDTFYFNAGVLLMNLSMWREKDYAKKTYRVVRSTSKTVEFPRSRCAQCGAARRRVVASAAL